MNTIKINYNYDTDKTKIQFNDEFNSLPIIQQLDAMKDALCLIEEKYITQLLTKEEVNEGANMNDIGVKD
tara:strand:+ start:489 stop:698 length:210 start_codon:yes stop_codon:yes gene_type:complete